MSSSRFGSASRPARRERMAMPQSGRGPARSGPSDMFGLQDAVDASHELAPGAALHVEPLLALGGDPVVAAAALAGLLDPAAEDPAALLEAVEQRVERGDLEAD